MSDDALETTRRALRATLARGQSGKIPTLMREHCLPLERKDDEIVVQRLMLAPEAPDGIEHAVPIVVVHCERFSNEKPMPIVCFMHGTGGDTESLLDTQLASFAKRGYLVVGVDAPCHGRRLDPDNGGDDKINNKKVDPTIRQDDDATHGHASHTRSRVDTFERYGAALVAAWKGETADQSEGHTEYNYSALARPFLFDGAWDALRAIQFITKGNDKGVDNSHSLLLPKVDPLRVGISGISLGGMYSWLAAAAAPEIVTGAVAPLIGAQDFSYGLRNEMWRARVASLPPQLFDEAVKDYDLSTGTSTALNSDIVKQVYSRITPGLLDEFDGPQTFPLIAPIPLLILNGELDPRNPIGGVCGVVSTTKKVYAQLDCTPETFTALAQRDTAHVCTDAMLRLTNQWLDATLRPEGCAVKSRKEVVTSALRDKKTWREL
tara:strand:- start:73 stop:1377 length:1305 start_codon:yes stop_codon:yes gene_type:complete